MKIKMKNDDYLYSSARVRALENTMLDQSSLQRMCSAKDSAELYRMLEEYGLSDDLEAALETRLSAAYELISEIAPDGRLFDLFRYQYDCHNLKCAIKCAELGTSPERIMQPFGTVGAREAAEAFAAGRLDMFPKNMADAASRAVDEYAMTHNPQRIDIILDRACFEDMRALAESSGDRFFTDYVSLREDMVNLLITLRFIRMYDERRNIDLLMETLVPFGSLDCDFFETVYPAGEDELLSALASGRYSELAQTMRCETLTLANAERMVENYITDIFRKEKYSLASPGILGGYLVARELEVKNLRIVMAGVSANIDPGVIAGRLRTCYV